MCLKPFEVTVGCDRRVTRAHAPPRALRSAEAVEERHGLPPPPGTVSTSGLLRCDRVKIIADGSLGAETAALRDPYTTKPEVAAAAAEASVPAVERGGLGPVKGADGTTEQRGVLLQTQQQLDRMVANAHRRGYRLEVHAIGDRAAEAVLGAFEAAKLGREDRAVLTHAQVLGDELIGRIAAGGVICNVQPSFAKTDGAWVARRLPHAVQPFSYCWKSLMTRQVAVAGGSDAPVEHCSPLRGMYDAMFRDGFLPEEALTFAEALALYTVNGAYATRLEQSVGQIRQGFEADFVVLAEDVAAAPAKLAAPAQLVTKVAVAGKMVLEKKRSKRKAVVATAAPDGTEPGSSDGGHQAGSKRKYNCPCCAGDGFFGRKTFGFY